MVKTIEFEIKMLLDDLDELIDREDELTSNSDLLSMYLAEWVNDLSGLSSIWNTADREQLNQVISKYEEVKPIAMKLKLPWPKELSK